MKEIVGFAPNIGGRLPQVEFAAILRSTPRSEVFARQNATEVIMTRYRIGDQIIEKQHSGLNTLLSSIYKTKDRPACLCRPGGIDMYVVSIEGKFHIKRMPNTGGAHDPACDSYEPPAELSGLGQVIGSAIIESTELGTTALKLDFSLSKSSGRAAPVPCSDEAHSVRTDGNKLTLRALLHYLWEEAGLQRWTPAMSGKRNWGVIRKYLLQSAQHKSTKGTELNEILYVPESFTAEHKEAIEQRRSAQMSRVELVPGRASPRRLQLLIGEVKEIRPSRYGHKLVIKHLPSFHFMMNHDVHKRLTTRFDTELSLWDAIEGSHLLAVATFGVNQAGVAGVEEIGLMNVTENWLPFESRLEKSLLDALTREGRRFVKGMRYNLANSRPLATAVLTDTHPPAALYIQPVGAGPDYTQALDELIRGSKTRSWIWHPDTGGMPAIPNR